MSGKIQASHFERKAAVYLRQSTLRQVHDHRESTARQYALRDRAIALGWPADRVEVLDEDLGRSGSTTEGRDGFRRLAEGIAEGRIGAIFALEISRLARSSADWHRLLDLCGLADVVIIDESAIYSPSDYNDRLLLGIKGTMSEAELHWMRLRLVGGKLNKVRRGEYRIPAPAGYVWDFASSRLALDPDEQVRRAIALVFERFRIDASAYSVSRYFSAHGLKLPARDHGGEYRWIPPRAATILEILHNPIFAGAYVYGRREVKLCLVNSEPRRIRKRRAIEEWKTCQRDRHPAYIGWEEFLANRKKLDENRNRPGPERRGAVREGQALLQGLLLCGRCGQRMSVHYRVRGNAQYRCVNGPARGDEKRTCWIVSSASVDRAVEKLFLEAVQPAEVELGLALVLEVEKQAGEVGRQWELRLDRARYEARLAERRYKSVDPDNRVVARTLERDWNDKLVVIEEIEKEYEETKRRDKLVLSDADRKRIIDLSKDLRKVWEAPTTEHADRKNLVRMLIRDITLSPIDVPEPGTKIDVLWQTGAVTTVVVARMTSATARRTSKEALDAIRKFVKTKDDAEIADALNTRGITTGAGKPWTRVSIRSVRLAYDLGKRRAKRDGWHPRAAAPAQNEEGLYSARGVAQKLGVNRTTVNYWSAMGTLPVHSGGGAGRDRWFELDRATIERLEQWIERWRTRKRGRDPAQTQTKEGHCA